MGGTIETKGPFGNWFWGRRPKLDMQVGLIPPLPDPPKRPVEPEVELPRGKEKRCRKCNVCFGISGTLFNLEINPTPKFKYVQKDGNEALELTCQSCGFVWQMPTVDNRPKPTIIEKEPQ